MEDQVRLRRHFGSSSHLDRPPDVSSRIPASPGRRVGLAVSGSRGSFTAESRPLPTLRPLSASSRTLSASTSSLLHFNHRADPGVAPRHQSLLATPGGPELPKSRQKEGGGPFQVDLLKGLAGLGVKVKVVTSGHVQITEVTSGGPLDKNRQARVGDLLLAVNSTPLAGLTDSRVQQIMRLLPRGLNKLVIQAAGGHLLNDPSHDKEEQLQNGSNLSDRKSQEKAKSHMFTRYDALTPEMEPTPSTQYSPEQASVNHISSGHDGESPGSVPVSMYPSADPILAFSNASLALGSSPDVQNLQAGNSVTTSQPPGIKDSDIPRGITADEARVIEHDHWTGRSLLEGKSIENDTPSARHLSETPKIFARNEPLNKPQSTTTIRHEESTVRLGETTTPTSIFPINGSLTRYSSEIQSKPAGNGQPMETVDEITKMTNASARKQLGETTTSIITTNEQSNSYPVETKLTVARHEPSTPSKSKNSSTFDENRLNLLLAEDTTNFSTCLSATPNKETILIKDRNKNLDKNLILLAQPSPSPTKAERNADSVATKSELTTAISDPTLPFQSTATRGSQITFILQLNPAVGSQFITTTQASSATSSEMLPLSVNRETASSSPDLASTQSNAFIASRISTNSLPVTTARSPSTHMDQLSSASRDIERASETQQDYTISQSHSQLRPLEFNYSTQTPSPQGIDNYKQVVTEFRAVLRGTTRQDGRKQGVIEPPILKESSSPALRPRISSASSYQDVSAIGKLEPGVGKLQASRYQSNERLDLSSSGGIFQTPVFTGTRGRSTSTTSLSTESEDSKHIAAWAQKTSINNQNVVKKLNQPDSSTSIIYENTGRSLLEPGFGIRASSSPILQKSRSCSTSSLDTIASSRSPSHPDDHIETLRASVIKSGQLNSALSPRSPLQFSPNSPSFVYPKRRVMQILEGSFQSNQSAGVTRSAAPKIIRTSNDSKLKNTSKPTRVSEKFNESRDLNNETVFFSSFLPQNNDTFVIPKMETDSTSCSNALSEKRNYELKPESPVIMRPVPAPRKIKKPAQTDDGNKLGLHTTDSSGWQVKTSSEFGNAFVGSEEDTRNSDETNPDSEPLQTFVPETVASSHSTLSDSAVRKVPQQRHRRSHDALPGPRPQTEISNTTRDSDSQADTGIRWSSDANQTNSSLIADINPKQVSSFSLDNSNANHLIPREDDNLPTFYPQPTRNVTEQPFCMNTSDVSLTCNELPREFDEGPIIHSSKSNPGLSDDAPPLPSVPPPQITNLDLVSSTTKNPHALLAETHRPVSLIVTPSNSLGNDENRPLHTDWFEDLTEVSFPGPKTHKTNIESSVVDQIFVQNTTDITNEVSAKLQIASEDFDDFLFPLAGISHQNEEGRLASFDLLEDVSFQAQQSVAEDLPNLLEMESFPKNEKRRASSPNLLDMMSEDSGMPADEDQELHTDDTISPPGEYADNAFGVISPLLPLDSEADILVPVFRVTDATVNSTQKTVGSNTFIESIAEKDMVASSILSSASITSNKNSSSLLDDDFEYHNSLPTVLLPQSLPTTSTSLVNNTEESPKIDLTETKWEISSHESRLSFNLNDTTKREFSQQQSINHTITKELEAQLSEPNYQKSKNDLVSAPSNAVLAVPVLISADTAEHPASEGQAQLSSKVQRHLKSNIDEQSSTEVQRKLVSEIQENLESGFKKQFCSEVKGNPVSDVHDQIISRQQEGLVSDTRDPVSDVHDQIISRQQEGLVSNTRDPVYPGASSRAWSLRSNTETRSPLAAGTSGQDLEAQLQSRQSSFSTFISSSELQRVIVRANALLDAASLPHSLTLQILHLHRDGDIVSQGVDIKQVGDTSFQISAIREGSPVWQESSVQLGDWLLAVDTMWSDNVARMRLLSRLSRPKHDTLLVLAREVQPGTLERHMSDRAQRMSSSEPVFILPDTISPSTATSSAPTPGTRRSPLPKETSDLSPVRSLPGTVGLTSTDLGTKNIQRDPGSSSRIAKRASDVTLTSQPKGSVLGGPVTHPEDGVHQVVVIKGAAGIGLSLEGGLGSSRGDLPVTVKRIFKGGPADKGGQLMVGDEILLVNGREFSSMRHYEAWNFLKHLDDGEVHLTIRRL